ncbi:MAG: conjugative transposon protein TraM [Chryseolinea sp.]
MKPHTQKFLQQRRFYMALPLLVLPFVTMIFWVLGGGQETSVQAQPIKSRVNTELPWAHFEKEDEIWDKFALYEQAKRDSVKHEEARRNDPYYITATLETTQDTTTSPSKLNSSLGIRNRNLSLKQSEDHINEKLAELNRHLNGEQIKDRVPVPVTDIAPMAYPTTNMSPDVERLEKMMELMNSTDGPDQEIQQIDGVLDKILDIQNPQHLDRIPDHLKTQQFQNSYAVIRAKPDDKISLMIDTVADPVRLTSVIDTVQNIYGTYSVQNSSNGFYGLSDDQETKPETSNALPAVIHDTQTIVSGSIIKLRLLSDIVINNQLVRENDFIYGVCTVTGERLSIKVNSIRSDNSLLPVALSVFDVDGLEGLYIPGAISRDVAKQAAGQSIQEMQLYSMNNSIGVQAATAGIEAAKSLFSKKTKLIKVTVKAGYKVLLHDNNQQSQTAAATNYSVRPPSNEL